MVGFVENGAPTSGPSRYQNVNQFAPIKLIRAIHAKLEHPLSHAPMLLDFVTATCVVFGWPLEPVQSRARSAGQAPVSHCHHPSHFVTWHDARIVLQ